MLSLELIRQHPDLVRAGIAAKNEGPEMVDEILEVDRERRELLQKVDELKHLRNEASEHIANSRLQTDASAALPNERGRFHTSRNWTSRKVVRYTPSSLLLCIPNLARGIGP